jgi:hypothetical protein
MAWMPLEFFVQNAWRRLVGLKELPETEDLPDYRILRESEWCNEFERLMRNRLVMGAFRYGRNFENRSPDKPQYDRVGSIKRRCDLYIKTGNTEHLVDIANLAMMEFGEGQHPNRHFSSVDEQSYHCLPKG